MSVAEARVQEDRRRHQPEPVLIGRHTDLSLTQDLLRPVWEGHKLYKPLLAVSGLGALLLFGALGYTFVTGIGVWGNNIPSGWAYAITNFVWWIGIGHAGTFISAILLLLEQKWRTSINRFAEAMTLFAVVQAGLFPIAHLGRAWFFYWLIPYPATMGVWPNFRSALTWDVAAISTYGLISALFWYLGLLPDLAAARAMAPTRKKRRIYGFFAFGWTGSLKHWRHYRIAYGLLGGIATPLVISVHSVVSLDFSIGKVPGWHSTMFPPYFVAGAIYSGFAMVLTLLIPFRRILGLQKVVTKTHLDNMAKVLLVTGSMVGYAYLIEHFIAWYSGNEYEFYQVLVARPFGWYSFVYWLMIACNVILPQLFWIPFMRRNAVALFVASLFVNVGMWTERFMIVIASLSRDWLPSSWHVYKPSIVDWSIFVGTLGFFMFLFLLFLRFVPFVPISELKEMNHEMAKEGHHG